VNCKTAKDLIIDHIYGELSARKRDQVVDHLQNCPDCQKMHQEYAWVHETATALPSPLPSAMTLSRITAEARDNAAPRRSWFGFPFLKWTGALTAAAIVALVAVFQFQEGGVSREMAVAPPASQNPAETPAGPEKRVAAAEPAREEGAALMRESAPPPAPEPSASESTTTSRGLNGAASEAPVENRSKRRTAAVVPSSRGFSVAAESKAEADRSAPPELGANQTTVVRNFQVVEVSASQHIEDGFLALSRSDYGQARLFFQQALSAAEPETDPHHRALLGLAQANEADGKPHDALRYYRLLTDDPNPHLELAQEKIRELSAQIN
jgi:hypothetical protein